MYGGHIVEDWDRRLANAYLFKYFNETLLEGMEMFPAFFTPANTMTHKQVTYVMVTSAPVGLITTYIVICLVIIQLAVCAAQILS